MSERKEADAENRDGKKLHEKDMLAPLEQEKPTEDIQQDNFANKSKLEEDVKPEDLEFMSDASAAMLLKRHGVVVYLFMLCCWRFSQP